MRERNRGVIQHRVAASLPTEEEAFPSGEGGPLAVDEESIPGISIG